MCRLMFYFLFLSGSTCFFWGLYYIYLDYSLVIEWEIFSLNSSVVVMAVLLDWMSLIFMSFVLFISAFVILYSDDYMSGDVFKDRFIILVMFFVLSMMFLIISPNMISILLGWDGLGLVSYCLVIYYQNVKSYNAGMLTALSNRIGDVLILLSIAWMLNFGSWNYIYYYDFFFSFDSSLIVLFVIVAGMTKSAQIPFSSWLPAAMAAPTPVSALVHSSTLVTAGVYLLIRFNSMIMTSGLGNFLLILGCLTMFMSGLGANYEFDLKSIIALSTLSQLGLMMSILSMGMPVLAFFHLLTHALFKALLFLCAGSYIHNLFDFQDIRCMGSLTVFMPYTSVCFNSANLSLCGFPFLAGFYSKDTILEMVGLNFSNPFIFIIFFVSTGLTVMYSVRLFYYSLVKSFDFTSVYSFDDSSDNITLGMIGLLFVSVFGGSILSWLIFPTPTCIYLPLHLKGMAIFVSLVGIFLGYELFSFCFNNKFTFFLVFLSYFSGSMWFMPFLSTKGLSGVPLSLGGSFYSFLDSGWSEYYGGRGMYDFFVYLIYYYSNVFDHSFKFYLMIFFLVILFALSLLFF
uniref:NADH-ubiquinone oxidoreductase chain 5 n=1 Tax=Saussurella borneensis TaxID=510017 RepID=A0A8F2FA04_9ORTH|nr:NADH dehydrogenase subunit 5 [Saussurella borneensis]